ncbi:Acyltransferase family domain containing protein [Naviculisporaceae sp. PSN 640]
MNGHAVSIHSLRHEESTTLLEEKSLSDIESEAGRADIEFRFNNHTQRNTRTRAIWHLLSQPPRTCLRTISNLRPACSLRSSILRIFIFLLPSFIQSRFIKHTSSHNHNHNRSPNNHDPNEPQKRRLHPTSYLDGMRGLAALFVFFCHYFYTCFVIAQSYGYGDSNYHVLKLPIIRLFYQGPPMVSVFFVISGYALSLKPLKLIRSRSYENLCATISSLIFRRGFRLFLPPVISTLMIMVLLRVGAYEWTREFAYDDKYMRNIQEIHYERANTTAEQLVDWGKEMFRFVHIWDWDAYEGSTAIDVHLWTIPVEFRASMMVFLTLLGTARLKTAWRFAWVGLVGMFCFRSGRWEVLLFYGGMVLAEVDLIRGAHSDHSGQEVQKTILPPLPKTAPISKAPSKRTSKIFWALLSILSLYLMSQPDQGGASTPGWIFLTSLIPSFWQPPLQDPYRYYQSIGAFLIVLCVSRSTSWQAFFNSAPIQYLGKISYAMYLMHGPVLHTLGYAIERFVWTRITGVETDMAYVGGFVLASLAVVPLVIWVSDVFWRGVDEPVVRFGKWLEGVCLVDE